MKKIRFIIFAALTFCIASSYFVFAAEPTDYKTIEWVELIPKDDLDALLNPPSYLDEIEDGSLEDKISTGLLNALEASADDRYQQALISTNVIPEMDGKAVRIPGFVVPLEFNDEQQATQFFLVPFFGACIHVPPPPPNQIIMIKAPQGLHFDNIYTPFWVSGVLQVETTENEMGISAYSMQLAHSEVYTED